MRGDTWKPRFCAVNKGRLFLYQDHDDKEAKKIIQLDGATVRRSDNMYKRPCVQIIYSAGTAGKQSLVLSSEDDDIGVWKYVWSNLYSNYCKEKKNNKLHRSHHHAALLNNLVPTCRAKLQIGVYSG